MVILFRVEISNEDSSIGGYNMGRFDYIFFDLDGTMIDSGDGITLSVQYALKRMGIIENELSALNVFVVGTYFKQIHANGEFSYHKRVFCDNIIWSI